MQPDPLPKGVLYIDDDPEDQEFFVTSLSESRPGTKVYLAKDMTSTLELINTIPAPTHIFIDLHLPRVNGIELLRKLKGMSVYANIPTYVLSSSLFEPYEAMIKDIGGNGFLKKPSTLTDFKRMLEDVLGLNGPILTQE